MSNNYTIFNARNRSIKEVSGTVPDVSGALMDRMQDLVFTRITKETVGFQVVETQKPCPFRGNIQPLSARRLEQKPEGERGWTWFLVHAEPVLRLDVDEIIVYQGKPTRVMARKDYALFGFIEYELVQDWN